MPITLGILASQRRKGPYTLSYIDRATSSGSVSSLSKSFTLGAEYSDRIVFVGIARTNTTGATSVTVGGVSCTKIGGLTTYGVTEWWYANSYSGNAGVTISASFSNASDTTFFVYVLGGGAVGGITPTFAIVNSGGNNTNYAESGFASATANDIFMAIAIKILGGSNSIGNFSSNMSPLTNHSVGVGIGTSASGTGTCSVGPVSAGTSVYVGANGFDSSKPIQISAIRFSKAVA